jgi:cytochrome c-type biogenesis protein CcmH/NrfG
MRKRYSTLSLLVALLGLVLSGCGFPQVVQDKYHSLRYQIKGDKYLENREYEEGKRFFEREIQVHPQSAEAHYYMGRIYLAEQQNGEAIQSLERATELAPKQADYHFWLGVAYSTQKQRALERKSYLRALEINDRHVPALTYLAHCQLEMGKYKKALKTYSEVIQLDPDNPQALYNTAKILRKLKRVPEEKQAWKIYLSYYPSGPMARQAVEYLNAMGDFGYRNHLIGIRTVTLKRVYFQPFTDRIGSDSYGSIDLIGSILKNNRDIAIHIVAYQENNKALAEARAKSIKNYLVHTYPEIDPARLLVSWFDVPESIKIGKKEFQEETSINFITAADSKVAGRR